MRGGRVLLYYYCCFALSPYLSVYLFFSVFVLLDFLVYLTSAILYFSFLLNQLTVPKFAKNCKVQILDVMLPFLWSPRWCLRWSDTTRAPLKLSAWNFPSKISNIPYTIYKHVEYFIYLMPNRPLSQLLWFLFLFLLYLSSEMFRAHAANWHMICGRFPGLEKGCSPNQIGTNKYTQYSHIVLQVSADRESD